MGPLGEQKPLKSSRKHEPFLPCLQQLALLGSPCPGLCSSNLPRAKSDLDGAPPPAVDWKNQI